MAPLEETSDVSQTSKDWRRIQEVEGEHQPEPAKQRFALEKYDVSCVQVVVAHRWEGMSTAGQVWKARVVTAITYSFYRWYNNRGGQCGVSLDVDAV